MPPSEAGLTSRNNFHKLDKFSPQKLSIGLVKYENSCFSRSIKVLTPSSDFYPRSIMDAEKNASIKLSNYLLS